MKLATFYRNIGPYLEGQTRYEDTLRALYGAKPRRDSHRIAIYERFCREHRNTASGGVHQVLRSVIIEAQGESAWRALVEDYFRAHPMQHTEINENGAHLAAYLQGRTEFPGWWAELADFEWWEWQTFIAPDASEDENDDGPLRIASTVELRPYGFNFVDWLDAEPRPATPELAASLVLFWRTRELNARRALATAEELSLLKAVSEGLAVTASETLDDLHGAGILRGKRP